MASQLEESKKAIEEYLKEFRMDRCLAGDIKETDTIPRKILYQSQPVKMGRIAPDESLPPGPRFVLKDVKLYNVGVRYEFDWRLDPGMVSPLWVQAANRLINSEAWVILAGLKEGVDFHQTYGSPEPTRADILDIAAKIGEATSWPDTIVMSPKAATSPGMRNDVFDPRSFGLGPSREIGTIGGIPVFWSNALDGGEILVYVKGYVTLIRQPLKVEMDDQERPSNFQISLECVSGTSCPNVAGQLLKEK